jgi:hypothetical protein
MESVIVPVAVLALVALSLLARRKVARRSRAAAGARLSFVEPQREPYPGDFTGTVAVEYSPRDDGSPDPGEIVWTWVPYEEDHSRGKDRPVLIVGRDEPWLLGLQLTSKDHDRDAADEARWGRRWMDIGTGAWDKRGRPSEVRLDRVLRINPATVRREGATLDKKRYQEVTRSM